MIGMMLGMLGLFGAVIVGAGSLLIQGFIPINYSILILIALGAIVSVYTIVLEFVTGGVAGVFAAGRLRGQPVAMILGNDKKVRFKIMNMKEGLGDVKNIGKFIIIPDSVYSMPNGTTGVIAYYKYAVNLHPDFIRLTSRLKENGVNDIEELEAINKENKEKGLDVSVNLDV